MAEDLQIRTEDKPLIRRYLIWCYKTTKEELDKIDRYFTQMKVDRLVLTSLEKSVPESNRHLKEAYVKKVENFKKYMSEKERRVLPKKFSNIAKKTINPEYTYLKNRLSALEETIIGVFGKKGLKDIQRLYEEEMTSRILSAREHT